MPNIGGAVGAEVPKKGAPLDIFSDRGKMKTVEVREVGGGWWGVVPTLCAWGWAVGCRVMKCSPEANPPNSDHQAVVRSG